MLSHSISSFGEYRNINGIRYELYTKILNTTVN